MANAGAGLTEVCERAQTPDGSHLERAILLRYREDVKPYPQLARVRQPEVLWQLAEPSQLRVLGVVRVWVLETALPAAKNSRDHHWRTRESASIDLTTHQFWLTTARARGGTGEGGVCER